MDEVLGQKTKVKTKSRAGDALDNDNIAKLDLITTLGSPADGVLKNAEGVLNDVVIIGFDQDGDFYFDSSKADSGDVLWLLEKAKKLLLEVGEDDGY